MVNHDWEKKAKKVVPALAAEILKLEQYSED